MKRVILAIIGGFVIPFVYTVIIGPLTPRIHSYALSQLLGYPVRWPIIILSRLVPLDSFPFRDQDTILLFVFIVLSDVLLYTMLTYLLLWGFSRRRSTQLDPPPNPPEFVQY